MVLLLASLDLEEELDVYQQTSSIRAPLPPVVTVLDSFRSCRQGEMVLAIESARTLGDPRVESFHCRSCQHHDQNLETKSCS